MENKDIKNLLNTVYELEGLAELTLNLPEGEKRDTFCTLIANKCYMLANKAAELVNGFIPSAPAAPHDEAADIPEEVKQHQHEQEDIDEASHIAVLEPELEPEPEPIMGIPAEIEDDEEEKEELSPAEDKKEEDDVEEEDNLSDPDIFTYQMDSEDEVEASDEEIDKEEEEERRIYNANFDLPRRNLRTYFTISDKYRFTRELFGNSSVEYLTNLEVVMSMHSYEEAEEYFYGDLQWDRESQDAQDFMETIRKYFTE